MAGSDPFWEPYTEAFYLEHLDVESAAQSRIVAEAIFSTFRPRSVVDVGCGVGLFLKVAEEGGAMKTLGVDCPPVDVPYVASGVRMNLDLRTVTEHTPFPGPWDMVLSLETAEHLPPDRADAFVGFLCSLGDTIVFSAALPGVGGTSHLNERPAVYWEKKFATRGFVFDAEVTERIVSQFRFKTDRVFYYENLRVYWRPPP